MMSVSIFMSYAFVCFVSNVSKIFSLTFFQIGRPSYRNGDQIFEERNDGDELLFGQKVPIGGAVSKDILGPAVEEERDILPPATDATDERDPLYVVHYVPSGSKEATSESTVPSPAPDVLSKILKSGKGAGNIYFSVYRVYLPNIFILYNISR